MNSEKKHKDSYNTCIHSKDKKNHLTTLYTYMLTVPLIITIRSSPKSFYPNNPKGHSSLCIFALVMLFSFFFLFYSNAYDI